MWALLSALKLRHVTASAVRLMKQHSTLLLVFLGTCSISGTMKSCLHGLHEFVK